MTTSDINIWKPWKNYWIFSGVQYCRVLLLSSLVILKVNTFFYHFSWVLNDDFLKVVKVARSQNVFLSSKKCGKLLYSTFRPKEKEFRMGIWLYICTVVKSKGKISQNFVVFSEYTNFTIHRSLHKSNDKNKLGQLFLSKQ